MHYSSASEIHCDTTRVAVMSSRVLSNTAASFSGRLPAVPSPPTPFQSTNRPCQIQRKAGRSTLKCSAALEGSLVRSRFPGFDDEEVSSPEPQIVTPESASWGLSVAQMKAMGIASKEDRTGGLNPVHASSTPF